MLRASFACATSLLVVAACGDTSMPVGTTDPTRPGDEARSCKAIEASVGQQLGAAIARNADCANDSDCVSVELYADCVDQCGRTTNKAGQKELERARFEANQSQCQAYKKQGCLLIHPPCVGPEQPKCVDEKCQ